jgi:hypothetical protein
MDQDYETANEKNLAKTGREDPVRAISLHTYRA